MDGFGFGLVLSMKERNKLKKEKNNEEIKEKLKFEPYHKDTICPEVFRRSRTEKIEPNKFFNIKIY